MACCIPDLPHCSLTGPCNASLETCAFLPEQRQGEPRVYFGVNQGHAMSLSSRAGNSLSTNLIIHLK